jgi:hypothetical protein
LRIPFTYRDETSPVGLLHSNPLGLSLRHLLLALRGHGRNLENVGRPSPLLVTLKRARTFLADRSATATHIHQDDNRFLAVAQAVEHYEMSRYGTLRTRAEDLRMSDAAELLEATLKEEEATDAALTTLARSVVNVEAESDL